MGYFCTFFIGIFEVAVQWAQYKILLKFDDDNGGAAQAVKLGTLLLIGAGLLSAIQMCMYFPGTDRGIAAIVAMIPGCIGAWIFKKRYKAKGGVTANKNRHG